MIFVGCRTFDEVWSRLCVEMMDAPEVQTRRWQGVEIAGRPGSRMRELLNVCLEVDAGHESIEALREDVGPNLPWADDHFEERVGGEPLNPGEQWRRWPYALAADAHRGADARFNHTYMERLWPKYARRTSDGRLPGSTGGVRRYPAGDTRPRYGIGHHWGDLEDLVDLLAREPDTRQAWIPLFLPEDTGVGDGGRKPCTLGYQVIVRDGLARMYYPLRSCDMRRHMRDDAYLAIRLLWWIVRQCGRRRPDAWRDIRPGTLAMHMTSLHCFENDHRELVDKGGWD